jgi:O-antigen ligase
MTSRRDFVMVGLLVVLIAVVAFGRGGYEPWATLVLELGAAAFFSWFLIDLWRDDPEERRHALQYDAWKRLPWTRRHPTLGALLRFLTLGRAGRSISSVDVEILLPGEMEGERVDLDVDRRLFWLGRPFRRNGIGAPLVLISFWILLSLIPIDRGWLSSLSHEAARWRTEAEVLAGVSPGAPAPWSLVPFLTLRGLLLWLAILAVFGFAFRLARNPEAASRLALMLLLLGALWGALGIASWFTDLHALFGQESEDVRATGTFGNPNHYAAFQAMLLGVSLGWIGWFRRHRPISRHDRRRPHGPSGDKGLVLVGSLAVLLLALGLVLSLSRSGMTFAIAGAVAFALLARQVDATAPLGYTAPSRHPSRRRGLSANVFWALGLAIVGFALWIGFKPLAGRIESLRTQIEQEGNRATVWRESAPALADYWLTGSGLSSFRHVGPHYRRFGGRTFYSWAHNDYLQLGIELGLPGLLLLAWLIVGIVRKAIKVRQDLGKDPSLVYLHAGYVAGLVAIGLHSMTDFNLHLPANFALLAVLVGVVVGMEPAEQ